MNGRPLAKRSKIVATIGPASNNKETLLELAVAGVDVFRLNFSHGDHEGHKKVIGYIREINEKFNFNIAILQDLQGPKIRLGLIEDNGQQIVAGETFIISSQKEDFIGDGKRAWCTYTNLARDVMPNDTILIDDGNLELRVDKTEGDDVYTTVVFGGTVKSRKGVNLPSTAISSPSLTEKDHKDLLFGIANDVDWIALSFVRSGQDIIDIKKIISDNGCNARVVAKVEKPEALEDIDAIIDATDAVMVARGDLGVEIPLEDVPVWQKTIVEKSNAAAKPVIIATQMMESMITNPRPTRAETTDIAHAVLDGADAVMLSAETAAGAYPVVTIKTMVRIIRAVETQDAIYNKFRTPAENDTEKISKGLVGSACKLADATGAKAIIGMTASGFTACQISSNRPKSAIYAFTENKKLLTTLNLLWGVKAYYYDRKVSTDATFQDIEELLIKEGNLSSGDIFINTASMPLKAKGKTNMLKIKQVD